MLALRTSRFAARTVLAASVARGRSGPVKVRAFAGDKMDVDTKQRVKLGDKLPFDLKVYTWDYKEQKPKSVTLADIFGGKKAVLFGLPGAYTSVCSNKHLPEYKSRKQELNDAGVELIVCASVNDAFVMDHWAKDRGVDPEKEIFMLADGECTMTKALGLSQMMPGLGERSFRYSMYLEDGVIKVLNIEEGGGLSYKIAGPSHMLGDLQKLKETGEGSEKTRQAA